MTRKWSSTTAVSATAGELWLHAPAEIVTDGRKHMNRRPLLLVVTSGSCKLSLDERDAVLTIAQSAGAFSE